MQTDDNAYVEYTVGSTPETVFAIPFQFWQDADLTVQFDGVTVVSWNTTGAGNPAGGSLTLVDPVSDGVLSIQRYVPEDRYTIFPIAGPFRIEALNTEFDRVIAMITDRRFVSDNDQVAWNDIVGRPDVVVWDDLYPVGSVHITFNPNPPPRGTWTLLSGGTFVVSAGGSYPVDTAGGENQTTLRHTLSEAELPAHTHGPGTLTTDDPGDHTHSETFSGSNPGGWGDGVGIANRTQQTGPGGAHTHQLVSGETDSTGGGSEMNLDHNNMPQYIAAYMWRRTA